MATVKELYSLWTDSTLRNHVEVVVVAACDVIRKEDVGTANHAARLAWAKAAFANPRSAAEAMLKVLLADKRDLTLAQLQAATVDTVEVSSSPVLTAVLAAVDVFADGA
ncbi:MAG TPA: hypothetical protein VM243_16270 [Phycisphaerae bacterium]|nr:hypothetical protein [Phycisphaerae bacterium]